MRLIDADKLPKYTGYALSADEVAMAVVSAPTVDLVEHGQWIYTDYYDLKCSKCGKRPLYYFNEEELDYYLCRSKYCPNCGVRMTEVKE